MLAKPRKEFVDSLRGHDAQLAFLTLLHREAGAVTIVHQAKGKHPQSFLDNMFGDADKQLERNSFGPGSVLTRI